MIGAIVVTYNPDMGKLLRGLEALLPQVDKVFVIDNSEGNFPTHELPLGSKLEYVSMGGNMGIAAAQNRGIKMLWEQGFDYALFSDQDSCASPGLVAYELKAHQELSGTHSVAAVGPMPVNRENGRRYFHEGHILSKGRLGDEEYYEVNFVISSFSLINLRAFEKVGLYNESLFIDAVETSWCFRAASYFGMKSFILPSATIDHELGKAESFLGKPISLSTPFRLYYQLRNLIWESREEYAPKFWKKRNLGNIVPKMIYFPLFCHPRRKYAASIYRGLRDGLLRKRSMKIPQYSGSTAPKSGATFSEWIQWYQVQPVTAKMKTLVNSTFCRDFNLQMGGG